VEITRKSDRRQGFDSGQSFPFTDCAGNRVLEDRRTRADRRLGDIHLEVLRGPVGLTLLPGGLQDGYRPG
jgi:hypothetical protein